MALFGLRAGNPFRTRDPGRDRETDAARALRINAFLADLLTEIERERDGLRGRYESATARAAFSQQALEDDGAGPEMAASVDRITRTMIDFTRRLDMLEAQAAFVIDLRERAGQFPQQTVDVRDPDPISTPPPA